jgi:hypothetical protein
MIEISGDAEPEWLAKEWTTKMMDLKVRERQKGDRDGFHGGRRGRGGGTWRVAGLPLPTARRVFSPPKTNSLTQHIIQQHNKHNLSDWEAGKLAKMWSICDWFKFKVRCVFLAAGGRGWRCGGWMLFPGRWQARTLSLFRTHTRTISPPFSHTQQLNKNHTHEPAFAEEAEMEAVNEEAAEKADEAFLMDFFKACSAWKHNKTWTWAFHKKNFTWFKTHKDGADMTASIEN